MSPYLRGTLYASAIVGAFVGGYLLKTTSSVPVEPGQPPSAVESRPDAAVALGPAPIHMPVDPISALDPPPMPDPSAFATTSRPRGSDQPPVPILDFDHPPIPKADDELNLSDPALQLIEKQMGLKRGILDEMPPPPPVLTEAQNDRAPTGMDPTPLTVPPKFDLPSRGGLPDLPPQPLLVRLVNRRDVALDFEITRIGLSKITSVELWTTRDNGKTWSCTDKKSGCQSPFKTRLGSEGEYGFRLVFESESGMRTAEPRPGSHPELSLDLDVTAPKIALFPLQPIPNVPGGVRVLWKASDAHLDSASISLEYSADGCEWCSIGMTGVRSVGDCFSQDWIVPADIPPQVLLRVTARDLAGNVGTVQSPSKVLVDLVAPEGKLIGVEVENKEPEMGPPPRTVEEVSRFPALNILQSMTSVLVNSPGIFVNFSDLHFGDIDTDRGPNAIVAMLEWIWKVTNNDILREAEPIMPAIVRRSSGELRMKLRDVMSAELAESMDAYERPMSVRPESRGVTVIFDQLFDSTEDDEWMAWYRGRLLLVSHAGPVSDPRKLLSIFTDCNWKPTTATPESYRRWEYKPVDPMWFWGSFPPNGVVLDF